MFGNPLRLDAATSTIRRPSVARVQAEIDLLKPPPHRIWVNHDRNRSFWQIIAVEGALPPYYNFCWHVGHQENWCTLKHPSLASEKQARRHQEYKVKTGVSAVAKESFANLKQTDSQLSAKQNTPIQQDSTQDTKVNDEEHRVPAQQEQIENETHEELRTDKTQGQAEHGKILQAIDQEMTPASSDNTSQVNVETSFAVQMDQELVSKEKQESGKNMLNSNAVDTPVMQLDEKYYVLEGLHQENAESTRQVDSVLELLDCLGDRKMLENLGSKGSGSEDNKPMDDTQKVEVAASQITKRPAAPMREVVFQVAPTISDPIISKETAAPIPHKHQHIKSHMDGQNGPQLKGKEQLHEGKTFEKVSVAHSSLNHNVTEISEGYTTRNPFAMLSMPETEHLNQLGIEGIQAELQNLSLDGPKVRSGGYTSDKDSKVKLTPTQRITRTRKKKKIFDL